MTRLIKYINESPNILELEVLKKVCDPYIKLIKKNNCKHKFLYKGTNRSYDFDTRKTRKNRQPLNMPKKLHDYLDKLFKKKFGVRLRTETLFTTTDIEWSSQYGIPHIIIPIGKFDYYWNPKIDDLFEELPFYATERKASKSIEKYKEDLQKIVDNYVKNKDFKKMMDKFEGEIMIDCKSYYIIDEDYKLNLKRFLFEDQPFIQKRQSILDLKVKND